VTFRYLTTSFHTRPFLTPPPPKKNKKKTYISTPKAYIHHNPPLDPRAARDLQAVSTDVRAERTRKHEYAHGSLGRLASPAERHHIVPAGALLLRLGYTEGDLLAADLGESSRLLFRRQTC